MHGRHVALFPLPGVSHVFPFLGLCPELVRRGYRVTVATIESVAHRVEETGAEPVIVETDSYSIPACSAAIQRLPMNDPKRWEELANLHSRWLLNSSVLSVRKLNKFYSENRPDLVVYELSAYAGRILAKRLHAPAVQFYPDFIQHRGCICWETSVGENPQSVVSFSRLLDSVLWPYGFEEPDNFWHSEDLNLCQFPSELQFNSESIDGHRFCFVGPLLGRPFRPLWKNQSSGRRVVLASSVGGSNDVTCFNKIIDALSGSEYHVILSVGERFPVGTLQKIPEHFEINQLASHLEILPHADLHISSGGPTGSLESLYFGVPLIAIPSYDRNYIIASNLAANGIVSLLPHQGLTGQMIRERVESVLQDAAYMDRVKQMQCLLRSSGGSAMAVDKIEEHLAGHA